MTTPTTSKLVVPPDGGERIWDGPIDTVVKVPASMTGDHLSITSMAVSPGYMVPPHTHADTDEWSYVVRGRIGARIGDEEIAADAGSWILKPRGRMHTFWNVGPEPAEIIELLTPGRFEHFFREMAAAAARDELTDERLDELAAAYGSAVDMAWVEDLVARYGLQVTL
jgi:quercetin dioxygenase-like cupin family protein